jgi:putative ABC transport system permease protein
MLPIFDLLKMTCKSLSSNLLRSGLTSLGVFMGVAAVNATLNIQTISSHKITQQLAERDNPYVIPWIYSDFAETPLTEADQQALTQSIPIIRSISTLGEVPGIEWVQFEAKQVKKIHVNSVSTNYLETTGRKMLQGRFFNSTDFEQYFPVAVVDQRLARVLFGEQNPVNQVVFASDLRFMVVGVVQTKPNELDPDSNGNLLITENFANVLQGDNVFKMLQITPRYLEEIPDLQVQVEKILRQRHPQLMVYADSNADGLLEEKKAQETSSLALAGVGLIALIIAGVGIANITIASVIERTKEIGIRRAIGATQLEVMLQFIFEAILLSLIGGAIAIITVHGATRFATTKIVESPYQFSSRNAALSIAAALAVGVGSSFIPALRATKVDIVKALKTE